MRMWDRSLASFIALRIWCYYELWCRWQMWLRSHIAVTVARSCSFDLAPSLGTSICYRCGIKKTWWALFVINPNCKQHSINSINESKKIWHTHYSKVKWTKTHVVTEWISKLLCEMKNGRPKIVHVSFHIWISEKYKPIYNEGKKINFWGGRVRWHPLPQTHHKNTPIYKTTSTEHQLNAGRRI